MTFKAPDEYVDKLGPCCTCGTTEGVTNIIMLSLRAPKPGTGWGCFVCGLPSDGAIAVLCDHCVDLPIEKVCSGYPQRGERVPVADLPDDVFEHDMAKHARADH